MSYTDGSITRAEQSDTGNGIDTVASKVRNGKTYQTVMTNDCDGTWNNSGATLTQAHSATVGAGAVFEARCGLDGSATADYWMVLVDKATAPENGDTIIDFIRVAKASNSTLTYLSGMPLANGLALCLSTTITTVTLPGDAKARFTWNADTLG